jgi:hypothetical protein
MPSQEGTHDDEGNNNDNDNNSKLRQTVREKIVFCT